MGLTFGFFLGPLSLLMKSPRMLACDGEPSPVGMSCCGTLLVWWGYECLEVVYSHSRESFLATLLISGP